MNHAECLKPQIRPAEPRQRKFGLPEPPSPEPPSPAAKPNVVTFRCGKSLSLFGRCILVALVAISGCIGDTEPSAKDKYEVDLHLSAAEQQSGQGSPVMDITTGITIETDVDALLGISKTLEMRVNDVSFKQRLKDLESQIIIADRVMELAESEDYRFYAARNKINALLTMHSFADLEARERLLKVADELAQDHNPDIRRTAQLARTTVRLVDYMRVDGADDAEFEAEFEKLLKDYPDSEIVAAEFESMIAQMMMRDHREKAISVMDRLSRHYSKSKVPRLRKFAGMLADQKHLIEVGFDTIAQQMRAGERGMREKFLEIVDDLAKRPRMSPVIYREIRWTELWLEESDAYDDAQNLLQLLEQNALTVAEGEFRQQLEKDLKEARSRLGMLGKPFNLIGQNSAGSRVATEDYRGKTLVVLFWSAKNSKSVTALQELSQIHRRYQSRGVEVIGVCIDETVTQSASLFGGRSADWHVIYRAPTDESLQSFEQTGVTLTPYMILVDQQGVVQDINVRYVDLPNQLDVLLQNRTTPESEPAASSR